MKTEFKRSFVKDLERVRDKSLKRRVRETIELIERVESFQEMGGVKKLRGNDRYYRIRIGNYRLGLVVEGDTVVFVRLLHRKDIYRYFP